MAVTRTREHIAPDSRWRAIIGEHTGVEVKVLNFNGVTVTCRPQGGTGKNWDRGKSHKNSSHFWRVPVDAFLNRYECMDVLVPKVKLAEEPMKVTVDKNDTVLTAKRDDAALPLYPPPATRLALPYEQEREVIELFRSGTATILELSKTYAVSVKALAPVLRASVPEFDAIILEHKRAYDRARAKRKYDEQHKKEPDVSTPFERAVMARDADKDVSPEPKVYGNVSAAAAGKKFEVTALVMRPVEVTETVTAKTMEEALAAVRETAGAVEITAVKLISG